MAEPSPKESPEYNYTQARVMWNLMPEIPAVNLFFIFINYQGLGEGIWMKKKTNMKRNEKKYNMSVINTLNVI